MKSFIKKLVYIVSAMLVVTVVVISGVMLAYSQTREVTVDNDYITKEADAEAQRTVTLPISDNVADGVMEQGVWLWRRSTKEVTVQYDYTMNLTNGGAVDIYEDTDGNAYWYQEEESAPTSILFNTDSAYEEPYTALDEDTCKALAYDYFAALWPNASIYDVCEYEMNGDRQGNNAYVVHFEIPIGDYFFGKEATVSFCHNGDISGVSLPTSDRYETMDEETMTAIKGKLPSRDEVPALLKTQMDEIYGEDTYTILDTGTLVVGKHGDGYALSCTVDIKTAMGWEELASFVYELN